MPYRLIGLGSRHGAEPGRDDSRVTSEGQSAWPREYLYTSSMDVCDVRLAPGFNVRRSSMAGHEGRKEGQGVDRHEGFERHGGDAELDSKECLVWCKSS